MMTYLERFTFTLIRSRIIIRANNFIFRIKFSWITWINQSFILSRYKGTLYTTLTAIIIIVRAIVLISMTMPYLDMRRRNLLCKYHSNMPILFCLFNMLFYIKSFISFLSSNISLMFMRYLKLDITCLIMWYS